MDKFYKDNEVMVQSLMAIGVIKTPSIAKAFLTTPRHFFVPEKHIKYSYHDIALPTFKGQTISQPYTVAVMLEALSPEKGNKILDIGSGTGWTTCLLSRIVGSRGKIIGLEIEPELVEFSKKNIKKLKIRNVEIILGDGKKGYKLESPYDRVLINAGCNSIPELVVDQTKIGGRIVAPINANGHQELVLFQKIGEGELKRTNLGTFVFVELR